MPTLFSKIRLLTTISALMIHLAAASTVIHTSASAQPCQNQFADGNLTLLVEFPNGSPSRYGFHPVKITAVNPGNQPVEWEIKISEEGNRDESLNASGYRERIAVPARRSVEREVLIPMGRRNQHSWSYRQVEVIQPSGRRNSWNPSSGNSRTDQYGVNVPALISDKSALLLDGAPPNGDDFHGSMNAPTSAPGDWRGYAAYSLVILTPDEWQAMPPAARTALGDWTRLGGHLQFLGDMPTDAPETDVQGKPMRGLGGVHALPHIGKSKTSFPNLPGALAAKGSQHPANEAISMNDLALLKPWLAQKEPDLMRDRFTIWPMVLVLIAFFIMITPVNLFMLAPSRQRHRLFRTIPLISLVACALLALAVGLGDGLGGKGRRLVWIESRPGTENRQFITQWQASRCGALLGTGFTVKDAAYLAPMRDPGSSVSLSVEGDSLEADGGWFTSRATQSHFLQAARPGRGRIEWSAKNADAPTAVSTFEYPLRDIYIPREDGSYWHAPAMRQGETTTLQVMAGHEVKAKLHDTLDGMPQTKDMHALALRTGHFIAFTDKPPAIDSLRSVRWKDTGVVTGALAIP